MSAALRGLPALACPVIPAVSLDTDQYLYLLCTDSNTFRSREEVVRVARAASVLEPAHHMVINATIVADLTSVTV